MSDNNDRSERPVKWTLSGHDVERRHQGIPGHATYDRYLPSSLVNLVPPPLLPLAAVSRRALPCTRDIRLERVPAPARADELLAGNQHDLARRRMTEMEEVKLVLMSNNGYLGADRRDHGDVMSSPSSMAGSLVTQTIQTSDEWTAMTNSNSKHMRVANRAQDVQYLSNKASVSSVKRPDEVNGGYWTEEHGPVVSRGSPPTPGRCYRLATHRRELDAKYWERRRKNNEAAKRSRDMRRANERRVALRAVLLEQENARLRSEVGMLTDDTLRLHYYLLCSRAFNCDQCRRSASE